MRPPRRTRGTEAIPAPRAMRHNIAPMPTPGVTDRQATSWPQRAPIPMRTFREASLHESAANAASIADADTLLIVAHALHSAGPSTNTGHRPVGTHRDASATPHTRHLRPTLTRITQTAHDDLTHITSPGCQHTGRNAPIHMRTFHETSLHESQTAYANQMFWACHRAANQPSVGLGPCRDASRCVRHAAHATTRAKQHGRITQTAHHDLTPIPTPCRQRTGRNAPIPMRTFHETSLHESAANAASIADADTPLIVAHALHSAGPSPNTGHRPVGTHRDASATPHTRHLRPTLTRTTQTAHDDLTHITSPGCQHTGRIVPIHMRTFRETSLHESQTAYVNPDVAGVPSRGQSTIGWPTSL